MKNIEIKIQITNITKIVDEINALHIEHRERMKQKDTYFLLGETRLKIREEKNRNQIIYYSRENKKGSRDSSYYILNMSNGVRKIVVFIFSRIFGIKKVVAKERDLYIERNTRIHIDKVNNLGSYLELETVVDPSHPYNEFEKEHTEIIEKLHLYNYPKIKYSYSDLVSSI